MARIEGKCREVLDKADWVAIATTGPDGPHPAGTWGSYIRILGIRDDGILLLPAGGFHKTEQNLEKDSRVELLCGTRQVEGLHGPGKGCKIRGTARLQTTGEFAEMTRKKFPWARGVLVISADEIQEQL